jgi:PAS domain S-box-containing protein
MESEKRLNLALEAGSMAAWDYDIENDKLNWNAQMFRLLGCEQTSGPQSVEAWTRRVLPEDLPKAEAAIKKSMENDDDLRSEYRVLGKNDEVLCVEARGRFERDKDGKAVRSFGVMMDITESKKIEQALRQQADLLDLANDAIMVCDLDGTIRFWNHGAEETYGYSKQQAAGKNAHELLCTVFPQPLDEIETLVRQEGHWEDELVHTTQSGDRIVVASRWVLQRGKDGQAQGVMEINRDITERKRAAELKQAETMHRLLLERTLTAQEEERRRIARELHDETGQSLTALLLGLRALEDARDLEEVKMQGYRLRKITAHTIDEIGLLARGLHPTVLDDLGLGAALSRYASEYTKTYNIVVDLTLNEVDSSNLPSTIQIALYRIIQEALTNVARHSGAETVRIRFTHSATAVEATIIDDGCGFDAKAVAVSSHRLGIHSMRERAAMLGGTVRFISQRKGTRIQVQIPLANSGIEPFAAPMSS